MRLYSHNPPTVCHWLGIARKWAPIFLMMALPSCNNQPGQVSSEYLQVVMNYADALIENGRDHYGKESSPLFAAALDRGTLKLLEGAKLDSVKNLKRDEWGIRRNDRTLSGANVMHQENLFQVLYALSKLTSEPRYAMEADKSLEWFLNRTQNPTTGLLVWGEHMGWDFYADTVMEHYNKIGHSVGQGVTHEFYRPWVLWNKMFELAPEPSANFAIGLWNNQISDHETGDFSRHAKWDRHAPGKNSQYPRHGGFYIATWAEAYQQTQDTTFLTAIETLLDFFERHASPETGAIPAEVGHKRSQGKMMWPQSNLSLAIDLWNSSFLVPKDLGQRMQDRAAKTDEIYVSMDHRLGPGGEGFITQANVHTLAAEDVRNMGKRVYSHLWETGYGEKTHAAMANFCYLRYKQVGRQEYKDLVLATAQRYMDTEPDVQFPVFPGTMGDVIYVMLAALELTEDTKYLDRADHFGKQSVDMFLSDSPLPAASSKHQHYEAITREDTLMMALLRLYVFKNRSSTSVSLVWSDR